MLTVSNSLGGQTLHELGFGSCPSVSHLCKIGCHMYILISGNNPKITARSLECILIGYTPHVKVYQCSERGSQQIVDSHHVSFVEHLAAQPRTLHPGVSVDTLPCDGEDRICCQPNCPKQMLLGILCLLQHLPWSVCYHLSLLLLRQ